MEKEKFEDMKGVIRSKDKQYNDQKKKANCVLWILVHIESDNSSFILELLCMAYQGEIFRHYWTICIVYTLTPRSRQQESCPLAFVYGGSERSIQTLLDNMWVFIGGRFG